jgi:uncharacterized membrane protein
VAGAAGRAYRTDDRAQGAVTSLASGDHRRLDVVDLGRGAVMVLMALDHTRTFLTNVTYNPSDVVRTYPALFLTRFLSHLCTPLFLFLAGTGAYLATTGRRRRDAASWLVTRALVLLVLEMTAVRWGWYFNVDYRRTSLQILWAIGASMLILAPLLALPSRVVGAIGIAIVALHNLAGPWITATIGAERWLWSVLYTRDVLHVMPNVAIALNFPVLPLFGVMAAGCGFGEVWRWEPARRRRACVVAGACCLALFVALRAFNAYGDPIRWAPQADLARSLMSFLSLTKHPLSLLMILATIGPTLIWMGLVNPERPWWRPVVAFGRVPMFFYVIHVPLIHALALLLAWISYDDVQWLLTSPFDRGATQVPTAWGYGLPGVYAWTVIVLAALYYPCRWYAELKARSTARWLSLL